MKIAAYGTLAALVLAYAGISPSNADVINPPCTEIGAPAGTVCVPDSFSLDSNTGITETNTTTTSASATVNAYQTEFVGSIQGGPSLYDQIFDVPFGDPSLSSTVSQIEAYLSGQTSDPLSFLAPTLVSSSTSSSESSSTVVNSDAELIYVQTTTTFGPATLSDVGEAFYADNNVAYSNNVTCTGIDVTTPATPANYDVGTGLPTGCSGTAPGLFIVPGQEDINTFLTDVYDIDQTTTDTTTDTTTQVYDIVGVPQMTSVPEPMTAALFGAGLVGAVAVRRRKKVKQG